MRATAPAMWTMAFDLSGTDPWPEMPREMSSMPRGIFSSVWTVAYFTSPLIRVTPPPSARQYSASIAG
jgi:hypothetical protein